MDSGAQYFFLKHELPKGWSYPLKRSVLDAALRAASVTSVFSVTYRLRGGSLQGEPLGCPLLVQFDGDEQHSLASGKVSITVYAVPSDERSSTMAELEAKLAVVCDWIRRAEVAPSTWRMASHELPVEMRDQQARLVERCGRWT